MPFEGVLENVMERINFQEKRNLYASVISGSLVSNFANNELQCL